MSAFDSNNNYIVYNVGIYLRLSKEDENTGQSESIENQRKIVENLYKIIIGTLLKFILMTAFQDLILTDLHLKECLKILRTKK